MIKIMKSFLKLLLLFLFLNNCETISKKVDTATQKEEEKLSKFLKKRESDLKIEFGKPDKIELSNKQNKILVYYDTKLTIKCERRFELNQNNVVVGFSSKNCF